MRKRVMVALLISTLSASMATACGTQEVQKTPVQTQTTSEADDTNAAAKEEDTVQSPEEAATGGGSPWIDSNLKNNITEDMKLSLKDDFHLAVNHDWLLNTDIKDGYRTATPFIEAADATLEQAQALFEDESLSSHDEKLIQNLYHAYLDWEKRDALGIEPMMKTIEDIQGISSIAELSEFICDPMERSMLVPVFLGMENRANFNDSSSYITMLSNDEFSLADAAEYSSRTEIGDRLYKAQKELAVAMLTRAGYSQTDAEAAFDSMIDIESRLAEVSMTSNDRMSPDYHQKINNVMSLSQAEALAPNFPIREFVKALGYEDAKEFIVMEPAYIERLNKLYTEENLQAIKNYMLVRYVNIATNYLDREADELRIEMNNVINGSSGRRKDEEYAFQIVQNHLTTPLDKVYLETYDATEKKQEITALCETIIEHYRSILLEQDWISLETREQAINKLERIRINAVYPEKWLDYSGLTLDGLSYYDCIKEIYKFTVKLEQSNTNQKVDKDLWDVSTLEGNAYYNPSDNSITILLGLLGSEFYWEDMSTEELYAGIGNIIAHEVSHAFDTDGAQYDGEGNLTDWWTEEDYNAFMDRADRLVAYYDGITAFEGANVIGANIQLEAIADMAGLKSILSIAQSDEDFDYELFFTHYAKVWRQLSTREFEYYCLAQDVHPLHYLRTNVTVQQFEEFYKTFHIQPGDNMYLAPEDRINVW